MNTMGESELRVAFVHDELTRRGGAEEVLAALLRLYPTADVYALYASKKDLRIGSPARRVQTTFLQRWPRWFRRHPARLLPWLPYAAEQLDLSDYDVVVSSASGFAKGVVTRAHVAHVCYCHTPTRYLWEDHIAVLSRVRWWRRGISKWLLHRLRLLDFAAAQRVDMWLANSEYTRARITKYYRQESQVVYPPIDTDFYTPAPRGVQGLAREPRGVRGKTSAQPTPVTEIGQTIPSGYFLCVGRLTPAKRFAEAIEVCTKLELPLVVVGTGRERKRLEQIAGPTVTFVGRVPRERLRELYRGARALLQPGVEDFGMAAAEAHACGTPVVALGIGGVREVVRHGVSGYLYTQTGEEGLDGALREFMAHEGSYDAAAAREQGERFAVDAFAQSVRSAVASAVAQATQLPYTET